jgi:hypothetical protein
MQSVTVERPAGWLARTTIAGFIALGVSTVTLVVASAIAGAFGEVYQGTSLLADWMYNLVQNPVTELGRVSLFASLALHILVGMCWAVLYALLFEPRLRRYPPWQAGVIFSGLPFTLSVLVFLPLVGGGLFGSALEAGPLPVLGNIVLHVIYGATLGAVYGAGAERVVDTEVETVEQGAAMDRAETSAARGIVIGLVVGGVIGLVLGAVLPNDSIEQLIGSWPIAMAVAGALAGGAVGALVGSMAGLTDPNVPVLYGPPGKGGEPIAAALIPLGVILVVATLIVSIGSGLLTVYAMAGDDKREAYNNAIILGLAILALVTGVATVLDRWGRWDGGPKTEA